MLFQAPKFLEKQSKPFDVAVVTGAGSGIGRALAVQLAQCGIPVVAVGRRADALTETAKLSELIDPISADVSTSTGREKIVEAISSSSSKIALVHGAAVVGELKTVAEGFDVEHFREMMAVNVEGPLFLTQLLRPLMAPGSRVLHLSSGAAHGGQAGFLPYCASKAALFSIYEALREELKPDAILVGSVMPGVVDTPMQETILEGTSASWPGYAYFSELRAQTAANSQGNPSDASGPPARQGLNSPANVGRFLRWLLMETADAEFTADEWDIMDKKHFSRWCPP